LKATVQCTPLSNFNKHYFKFKVYQVGQVERSDGQTAATKEQSWGVGTVRGNEGYKGKIK